MLRLERRWNIYGEVLVEEFLTDTRQCNSLQWMCCQCGDSYAQVRAFRHGRPQPYSFIHGLCRACRQYQHDFNLAGSLECVSLVSWEVPRPILDYQLALELTYAEGKLQCQSTSPHLSPFPV